MTKGNILHSIMFGRVTLVFRRSKNSHLLYIGLLLLLMSSDCELNPGPRSPKYPCQICDRACGWGQRAIACDNCNSWYHTDCLKMQTPVFKHYAQVNISWICCTCGLPSFSSSLFDTFIVSAPNPFEALDSVSSTGSDDDSDPGLPLHTSSPKMNRQTRGPQHGFRIVCLNLQSMRAKKASFLNLVEMANPDVV